MKKFLDCLILGHVLTYEPISCQLLARGQGHGSYRMAGIGIKGVEGRSTSKIQENIIHRREDICWDDALLSI